MKYIFLIALCVLVGGCEDYMPLNKTDLRDLASSSYSRGFECGKREHIKSVQNLCEGWLKKLYEETK